MMKEYFKSFRFVINPIKYVRYIKMLNFFVGRCFGHYLEILYRSGANITSKEIIYIQGFLNQICIRGQKHFKQ